MFTVVYLVIYVKKLIRYDYDNIKIVIIEISTDEFGFMSHHNALCHGMRVNIHIQPVLSSMELE